jgi:peptidoglycan hydrolase CwlO-like protein
MSATSNPEIAALWKKVEQLDKEIAEIRASVDRLSKIVRGNLHQAVWQSVALVISICIAVVGGLAYQTSVLNKRFEQIEKRWKESDEKFAERSELSAKTLNTHVEQSKKKITARFEDLKQEVRAQCK